MKTENIVSTFRNAATPAARLAAWQNRPLYSRRKTLESAAPGEKLSLRRSIISQSGPELSAPEAGSPLLWLSGESDGEIQDAFAGRDFLDHHGWYADEFQDETLETYAVRLIRFPRLLFYAVKDSCNGNLRVHPDEWEEIDFSDVSGEWEVDDTVKNYARSLVRSCDSTTQREAEDEMEYQKKWQIENDIEENRETLKSLRHEIRALAHELKTLCPSPLAIDYPAAGKALRDSLKSLLSERRELMVTNQELAASL